MSYPTIGMPDLGITTWGPSQIEQMLREGTHIYEDHEDGESFFDKEDGKFIFQTWVNSASGHAPDRRWEFGTYVELATFLAFMGKDFL